MECAFQGVGMEGRRERERERSGSVLVPVSFSCPLLDLLLLVTADPKRSVVERRVSLCSRGEKRESKYEEEEEVRSRVEEVILALRPPPP